MCYVEKDEMDDLVNTFAPRTVREQRFVVDKFNRLLETGKTVAGDYAKLWSSFPTPSFLWEFKYASTPWGNPYLALMPDVLHQSDVGVWGHIRDALATLPAAKNGAMDTRLKWFWENGRIAGLYLPHHGTYFGSGANVSAAEHRAIMQVSVFILEGLVLPQHMIAVQAFLRWYKALFRPRYHTDASLATCHTLAMSMIKELKAAFPKQKSKWKLIKVHMVVHFEEAIKRGGLPEEYSTNMYEHFHKDCVKRPYRASNRREWTESIIKSNQFHQMLSEVESDIKEEREYNSAFYEADTEGKRVLLRTHVVFHMQGSTARRSKTDQFEIWNTALGGRLTTLQDDLESYDLTPQTLHVFTGMAVPAGSSTADSRVTHFVRANPSHHGQLWFSHAAIRGAGDEVWYGEILLLFKILGSDERFAYVQYYDVIRVDALTGCKALRVAKAPGTQRVYRDIIDVDTIFRAVHIVESFARPGTFMLNDYLFD
ncbi:hypothetical protein CLOM_g12495 [Closterium sp. NIES-68]|nr:hypothetical protein CLOM_g20948 [Closterium sp. NIES-68]GJP47363.1 hypothetical protein CLOM_g6562 [Closterium sp. NIES-68]GJP53335.1 hypothetical protein CLOM_g12495 [Closterium sp. NIES-68]GJP66979.1 hypothetical protein CLOP_g23851 [Closterium sp. NIES-67]GJP75717.1 hypothetical protein CLOP_g6125 [Closterium sp. NIES-67]